MSPALTTDSAFSAYSTEKQLPFLFFDTLLVHKIAAAQANYEIGMLPADVALRISQCAQTLRLEGDSREPPPAIWHSGCGLELNRWANRSIASAYRAVSGTPIDVDVVNLNQSTNDTIPTVIHVGVMRACEQTLQPACSGMIRRLQDKAERFASRHMMGRTFLRDAKPIPVADVFSAWAALVQEHGGWLEQALAGLASLPQGGYSLGNGDGADPRFSAAYVHHLNSTLHLDCSISSTPSSEISGIRGIAAFAGALAALASGIEKIAGDVLLLCSGPDRGFGELRFEESGDDSTTLTGKSNPIPATTIQMVCTYSRVMCGMVTDLAARGQLQLYTSFPVTAYALFDSIEVLGRHIGLFADGFLATLAPARQDEYTWNG